ncbi:MAG: aminotransferase class V-fold PLP-dependent enzyme [Spirochaetaceae bacterium]|nr:aminotransferase class V-fold PLP-dependent enzyme [Spirochaetaceae bacterium]
MPYFDNATTSFPKAPLLGPAMANYLTESGGSYGRGLGRRMLQANLMVEQCRNLLAAKFLTNKPQNIIFTGGATEAINLILNGLSFNKDDLILLSPLEHNAVLRPVQRLKELYGINYEVMPHFSDGLIDAEALSNLVKVKKIRLAIINMVSNVNGLMQPIKQLKEVLANIPLMLDSAQYLTNYNNLPIEADYVVFAGHKGLLGPQGIGGFYLKDETTVNPTKLGGYASGWNELAVSPIMPDRFEAGTLNMPAIAGLLMALRFNEPPFISLTTWRDFIKEVGKLGYHTYKANDDGGQGAVVSLSHQNFKTARLAQLLYDDYAIESRAGYHCALLAHQTLQTLGAVRFSYGPFTTNNDLEQLLKALTGVVTKL